MRVLVTNDDGIDSHGLHELARALVDLGDVTVVAPDAEYSGAGASLGAMHLIRPEVHNAHVDGVDRAWSLSTTRSSLAAEASSSPKTLTSSKTTWGVAASRSTSKTRRRSSLARDCSSSGTITSPEGCQKGGPGCR